MIFVIDLWRVFRSVGFIVIDGLFSFCGWCVFWVSLFLVMLIKMILEWVF